MLVELNEALIDELLTEEHRGYMLSKEPSASTLKREICRWKHMSKSQKVEAYVRLGVGWPRLLLRVREAQIKEKKRANNTKSKRKWRMARNAATVRDAPREAEDMMSVSECV